MPRKIIHLGPIVFKGGFDLPLLRSQYDTLCRIATVGEAYNKLTTGEINHLNGLEEVIGFILSEVEAQASRKIAGGNSIRGK